MPEASNLAILMFSTCFFSVSGGLKVAARNFMQSRSRDGLAAKGLRLTKERALLFPNSMFAVTLRMIGQLDSVK